MSGKYEDMLDMKRPFSPRQKMSMTDRAAQFSPFAALSGFDDVINETNRLTDEKPIFSEDQNSILNETFLFIEKNIHFSPEVILKIFEPDKTKNGGKTILKTGSIKKINREEGFFIFSDGSKFSFSSVISIAIIE